MKKDISFEEALEKLAQINEKLESEDISLDESVKLFKEGKIEVKGNKVWRRK